MSSKTLQQWVRASENLVFFGGAGVSTESGIPDFRSVDGLFGQRFQYPPEVMLSREFFIHETEEFFAFYRAKMLHPNVKPNAAHHALARLEAAGKLRAVITQNIDGLHQQAGSKNVLELHGSVARNFCLQCEKPHGIEALHGDALPACECGGIIKPDVVLYGESLPEGIMERAVQYVADADMLIVGGTSLRVYPAAGLIDCYRGNKLVLINQSTTEYDTRANLIIRQPIGEVLEII